MEYLVGDRVIAARNICSPANDHSPAMQYASRGDVLVIRAVGVHFPYYVSHENVTDSDFGVTAEEIQPLKRED